MRTVSPSRPLLVVLLAVWPFFGSVTRGGAADAPDPAGTLPEMAEKAEMPRTTPGGLRGLEPLDDPSVARAVVWADGDGAHPYATWDAAHRRDLARALAADPDATVRPLQLDERGTLSAEDAWQLYLAHLAHALRLERERAVPWSLGSFSPRQLTLLLDARSLFERTADGRYAFGPAGPVATLAPAETYRFLQASGLVRTTQEDTAYAIVDWLRQNLAARSLRETAPPIPGSAPPTVAGLLAGRDPRAGQAVADCWTATGLLAALVKSANVPARQAVSEIAARDRPPQRHSRLELPTVGLGLVHSSDLFEGLLLSADARIPTPELFAPLSWLRDHVDHPRRHDCQAEDCHRPAEQAAFNIYRRRLALAATHLPDGLLIHRARDGTDTASADALWAVLTAPPTCDGAGTLLVPIFAPSERAEILRRVDAEIRRQGGGDWQTGAARIARRWEQLTAAP